MKFTFDEDIIRSIGGNVRIFSYYASPDDNHVLDLGRIFIIIEIRSREKKIISYGPECIAVLKDNFYHSPSSDIEASLELACQKFNAWILTLPIPQFSKRISASVLAIRNDLVAFTTAQYGRIHLVRNKKILTMGTPDDSLDSSKEIKTKKVFTNLTSGTLEHNDLLILSSNSILDYFSEEKLLGVLRSKPLSEAASQLERVFTQAKNPIGFESIMIQAHREAESAIPAPIPTTSDTGMPDVPSTIAPLAQESMRDLGTIEEKTGKLLEVDTFQSFKKKIKQFRENISFKKQQAFSHLHKTIEQKLSQQPLPEQKISLPKITPGSGIEEQQFSKLRFPKRTLLLLGIGALGIFIVSLIFRSDTITFLPNAETKERIQTITSRLDSAEAALLYDNFNGAKEQYQQAEEQFFLLPTKKQESEHELRDRLAALKRTMYHITLPEHEILIDFTTLPAKDGSVFQSEGIFTQKGTLYAYRANPLALYEIAISAKTVKVITLKGSESIPHPVRSVADEDTVYFLDSENHITAFSLPTGDTIAETTLPETVRDISPYAGRLYALTDSGITRLTKQQGGKFQSAQWITDGTVLTEPQSLTIDGSIYIGQKNSMLKMNKGVKIDFSLSEIDIELIPAHITTFAEGNALYILDSTHHRIITSDKTGIVASQLDIHFIQNPTSIVVDEVQKNIFVHGDNKIYRVHFP